ncbi:MAG: alpha/beta fold hydrolase [Armatimonadetes bacterium]|nr:alpha/beta fold hydrolase [Armatimonadota bacterium]
MTIVLSILAAYLVALVLVALLFLRPARSPIFLSPAALGAPMEEVEFECEGLALRGWWVPHEKPCAVAIMLHGYLMNRAENAALAAALNRHGFACLLFDTRASGKSGGRSVGLGWRERKDALAACGFAAQKAPGVKRVLFGVSMGAAAAAFALAEKPDAADALILDSCYHGLASAGIGWWRFLGGWTAAVLLAPVLLVGWPISGVNPFRVNVGRALKRVSKPTLILHGRRDILASPRHAEMNFRAAAGPKKLTWSNRASHAEMRWIEPERYMREMLDFMEAEGVIAPSGQ